MIILPNGVAAIEGDTCHRPWVEKEGLVHDKFARNLLTYLCKLHEVRTAVDAGAHIGTITRILLDAGAAVHCFEANYDARECLHHNCPEAVIYPWALGEKNDYLALVKDANAGASYLSGQNIGPDGIEVIPLDGLQLSDVGLIKLDIEGFELKALKGAQETIKHYKPVIYCEVNQEALYRQGDTAAALLIYLEGLGYSLQVAQPDCKWGDPQYDVVATPK